MVLLTFKYQIVMFHIYGAYCLNMNRKQQAHHLLDLFCGSGNQSPQIIISEKKVSSRTHVALQWHFLKNQSMQRWYVCSGTDVFLWNANCLNAMTEDRTEQQSVNCVGSHINMHSRWQALKSFQVHHLPPKSKDTMRLEAILMLQRSWGSEPPCRPRIISDKASGTPDSANWSFSVSGGTA